MFEPRSAFASIPSWRSPARRSSSRGILLPTTAVAGSDPAAELAETEIKLGALLPLLAE